MVMNKKTIFGTLIFCLGAGLGQLAAQPVNKYFVKFKDKNQTPYQITNANPYLTPKAINRRLTYNIPVDSTDLPVNPTYLAQLDALAGVNLLYSTKWLNGAVVTIPTSSITTVLASINALPYVANSSQINPRLRLTKLYDQLPSEGDSEQQSMRSSNSTTYNMGGSTAQNQQIQVDCLHNMGFRGQGMVIGVMDVGFNNVDVNTVFDSLRLRGGILGTRDFITGGNSVYEDGSHGALVLSCMAAIKHGTIMGSAPMADYWLLRTEDIGSETLIEEYNWVRAAEFADSVGVDILTTSLGYTTFDNPAQNHTYATLNGKTAPMSIASTMAARKGIFVLTAAGNEGGGGWNYISVPADADSVCTVGAVDNLGIVGSFSGVGPTSDGRTKPDLLARGVQAWVADVNGTCMGANGTSFATPILAGGVACIWQRNRAISNIKLLQLLKTSANNAAVPTNTKGWGIPNVCSQLIGIEENYTETQVSVYPNPFSSAITLRSDNSAIVFKHIQLLDVLGHVVAEIATDGMQQEIDLNTSNLAAGVYFIQASTSSGLVSKKIVKH